METASNPTYALSTALKNILVQLLRLCKLWPTTEPPLLSEIICTLLAAVYILLEAVVDVSLWGRVEVVPQNRFYAVPVQSYSLL